MINTDRYAVHRHLAHIMDTRLALLKHAPQQIILAGADGDGGRSLLAARFPQSRFREYDPRPDFLDDAAAVRKTGLLAKWTGKTVVQHCQSIAEPLGEPADMLWANLSLLTETAPVAVFENWASALKNGGLLFFSHLGGDSLADIRTLLAENQISCPAPTLLDMHDLGDMLFHHGFYDPVMDTEKLVLTYRSAEALLQDLSTLGAWQALQCDNPAAAENLIRQTWQQGGLRQITLETVFGHAVKKADLAANEQEIRFIPRAEKKSS